VKSGQTKEISQRVESYASLPSLDSTISFGVPIVVTQFEHYIQEEEATNDVIEDLKLKGQVPDSITVHKPKRNT